MEMSGRTKWTMTLNVIYVLKSNFQIILKKKKFQNIKDKNQNSLKGCILHFSLKKIMYVTRKISCLRNQKELNEVPHDKTVV